jgi:deazaflavin-dependent oxidoreductase (nitroreductase family)
MPTKVKETHPPHGFTRLLVRLPIWLYQAHLGWLLGGRLLRLTHVGRKSGLSRQTILEVIQHDKMNNTYAVLAPWGERADWVRNIEKTPEVVIDVGGRRLRARAIILPPEEAEEKMLDYVRRHPIAGRLAKYVLPRLLGYKIDDTEEDFRALVRMGMVVAFHPISS